NQLRPENRRQCRRHPDESAADRHMGLTPVPAGEVAAVVTTLEMLAPPRPAPMPGAPLRLIHWPAPDREKYRALFRRIGTPWLWFSRLVLADEALDSIIGDPAVEIRAVVD